MAVFKRTEYAASYSNTQQDWALHYIGGLSTCCAEPVQYQVELPVPVQCSTTLSCQYQVSVQCQVKLPLQSTNAVHKVKLTVPSTSAVLSMFQISTKYLYSTKLSSQYQVKLPSTQCPVQYQVELPVISLFSRPPLTPARRIPRAQLHLMMVAMMMMMI